MARYSDNEIDAILKRIQDNVDKQKQEAEDNDEAKLYENDSVKLVNELKNQIGEPDDTNKESNVESYDISGFEIGTSSESVVQDSDIEKQEELSLSKAQESDVFDELSVADNFDAEDITELNKEENDEIVRAKVEEFVNATVDPDDDFIFFESLDRRLKSDEALVESIQDDAQSSEQADNLIAEEEKESVSDEEQQSEELPENLVDIGDNIDISDYRSGEGKYCELDDSDINLSVSLGSKDSMETALGLVRVRESKHNFVNPDERYSIGNAILEYAKDGKEYKQRKQEAEIFDAYRKEKKRIGKRLILSSLVFLVLLLCEFIFAYKSISIPYASEILQKKEIYYTASLLLLSVVIALSAKKLFKGLIGFFIKRTRYHTVVGFVTFVNVIYSILVLTVFRNNGMPMMNSVCVFAIILSIVGEYMQISREIRTFKLITSDKDKISLEPIERTAETINDESFLRYDGFLAENTHFVGKYFERSARTPQFYRSKQTYLIFTMLLSLVVSVVAVILTRDIANFVLAFELTSLLCIPVQFILLGTYRFYIVSKQLYKQDSALIGETVVDEYVGNNTIYLDDIEVFGKNGVKIMNVESFNGFNIVDINYFYMSVFSKINSPLKNAFGENSYHIELSENVELKAIYSGGIEAVVDGKHSVCFGTEMYINKKGINFGNIHKNKDRADNISEVMYMCINNILCAKLSLKYSVSHRFEAFAEEMEMNHSYLGIRTVDPNVNEKMLLKLRSDKSNTIKVIRPTVNDLVPIMRRSDSGIITAKNTHMIARILAKGLKIKRSDFVIDILWGIYALLGLGFVVACFMPDVISVVQPFYIVVYQILWAVGVSVYIKNILRNKKSK